MSHGTGPTNALTSSLTPPPPLALAQTWNQCFFQCLQGFTRTSSDVMALPFDVAREQYARSVQAGLLERSLLQSARVSRTLGAMEQLALGPFARH